MSSVVAVEFRLLGPVEVYVAGRAVGLARSQLRTVVAVLAAEAGRVVPAETLLDRLWEDGPPKSARAVLQSHLTRLRQALEPVGPVLARRPGGYLLDVDPDRVDLHAFRRAVAAAEPDRPDPVRAELLAGALRLWHGTALAGLPGRWAARARAGWTQQRIEAAVAAAEVGLRLGRSAAVLTGTRALLAEHPLAEPLVAVLLRALVAEGREAEALALYARHRAELADELGTEPGAGLRALHQSILTGTRRPRRHSAEPRPAQLPRDIGGFTGRQAELSTLDTLLEPGSDSPSTVAIAGVSGMAGVGKTALVVHWAHRVAHRFTDGVLYVNLRGFDPGGRAVDTAAAVRRFLDALGAAADRIPAELDAQAALYRSLSAGRRLLVVLDNARAAEQVRPLLPGTGSAVVVVTSRHHLTGLVAADGAQPVSLGPLSTSDARALLAGRLGRHRVAAEPAAVDAIIAACARLPLALGIAAARAAAAGVPLPALAAELTAAGPDGAAARLGALDAGDPASNVSAVFSWSYRALSPAAARLFRLLGLHPGPDVTLGAAAALADLPASRAAALLTELTRASLLAETAPGRWDRNELVGAYAADLARTLDPPADRAAAAARLAPAYDLPVADAQA
jgi:DNA-binding SARP family transcriptional activator